MLCHADQILVVEDDGDFCSVSAVLRIKLQCFSAALLFQESSCMLEPGLVVAGYENLVLREFVLKNRKQWQPVGNIEPDKDVIQEQHLAGDALYMALNHAQINRKKSFRA